MLATSVHRKPKYKVKIHIPFERTLWKSFAIPKDLTFEELKTYVISMYKKDPSMSWTFVEVLGGYERLIPCTEKVIPYKGVGKLVLKESINDTLSDMDIKHASVWTPIPSYKFVQLEKTLNLISKLQCGIRLTTKEMIQCSKLHFGQDPLFEAYLDNQNTYIQNNENPYILIDSDCKIEFNKGNTLTRNKEYTKTITLSKASDGEEQVYLETHLFDSQSNFLGSKMSRYVLYEESSECRAAFVLMPLSPKFVSGIIMITSYTKHSSQVQQFVLSYRQAVSTKEEPKYWHVNLSELVEHKSSLLGTGASSCVYESTLYGQTVACKVLKQQGILSDLTIFHKEVENLSNIKLRHPNVITFLGASEKRPFRIITEKLECSLQHLIETKMPHLSLRRRIRIAMDLVSALHHLHSIGLIHRDFKSANVMISSKGRAKIADFGFSENIGIGGRCRGVVGTQPWIAPEVMETSYGHEADIYGFGVTFFEVISYKSIFDHSSDYPDGFSLSECFENWRKKITPEQPLLYKLSSIIMGCCQLNPNERIPLPKILSRLKKIYAISKRE